MDLHEHDHGVQDEEARLDPVPVAAQAWTEGVSWSVSWQARRWPEARAEQMSGEAGAPVDGPDDEGHQVGRLADVLDGLDDVAIGPPAGTHASNEDDRERGRQDEGSVGQGEHAPVGRDELGEFGREQQAGPAVVLDGRLDKEEEEANPEEGKEASEWVARARAREVKVRLARLERDERLEAL